ncbi:hypothetical protein HanXRQr2_Chr15g0693871 [Helianthus annuus]|uniref:Uncharacterized protein n=1 Tax=Helianthus annuus TaxID=4232 RepID=A0A9K3H344_HELAN|nr:hypothetical protein HanXRQr2_Chr15g0693871 [Helianthus annuus]
MKLSVLVMVSVVEHQQWLLDTSNSSGVEPDTYSIQPGGILTGRIQQAFRGFGWSLLLILIACFRQGTEGRMKTSLDWASSAASFLV